MKGRFYILNSSIPAALMATIVFLFPARPASAESDSVRHIDEVVVTARRTPETMPAQKFGFDRIRNSASNSVADALRNFAGVQIKDYGGIGGIKTIDIRSLGTNHTGVFYDGVQIGNALNGQTDLGKLSLDNVGEISLYNGQRGTILQSAKDFASSGSIYITSSEPVFDRDEKNKFRVEFRTASFQLPGNKPSYGLTNPSINWQHKIGDAVSMNTNVEFINSDGRYKTRFLKINADDKSAAYDTTIVRENGDITSFRAETGLFGKITGGEWRAKAYLYLSDRGLPGPVVRNKYVDKGARLSDRNFFVQSTFKKNIGICHILLTGKYANDYTRYVNDDLIITENGEYRTNQSYDNTYVRNEFYLSSATVFGVLPILDVALSVDFLYEKLDSDLKLFAYPRRYNGLFVPALNLKLEKLNIQANIVGNIVKDKTETGKSNVESVFTPTIILSYKPFEKNGIAFRAFYKESFRTPTFNELYYTTNEVSSLLKPEYTRQYNIGSTYVRTFDSFISFLQFGLDIYYNEARDKITAYPSSNQFRWTMLNLGRVSIEGLDFGMYVQTKSTADLSFDLRVNYTFQNARDITDKSDDYYGGRIPYVPRHGGSAIFRSLYKNWTLTYGFIYTGERYSSRANIDEYRLQPWYTTDISLVKRFPTKYGSLKFSAEVCNLFDQYFDIVINYPMPGRNYKLGLSIEF